IVSEEEVSSNKGTSTLCAFEWSLFGVCHNAVSWDAISPHRGARNARHFLDGTYATSRADCDVRFLRRPCCRTGTCISSRVHLRRPCASWRAMPCPEPQG